MFIEEFIFFENMNFVLNVSYFEEDFDKENNFKDFYFNWIWSVRNFDMELKLYDFKMVFFGGLKNNGLMKLES